MGSTSGGKDYVLRALTDDGSFRVITARTTQTVQRAIEAQATQGVNAEHFGELLTGAVIVRETMAPTMRVQVALIGAGAKGSLIADSHPGGLTRGLVNVARTSTGQVALGEGARVQVTRTLPSGSIQQGVVGVPEDGGISAGLMSYMSSSEQVVSMIGVACLMSGPAQVEAAAGYIVQVLPEVGEDPLRAMIERLEASRDTSALVARVGADPEALLRALMQETPHTKVEENDLFFGCTCDVIRVVASLATLGRQEIEEIIREKKSVDVTCDYCGAAYEVGPEQLKPLVMSS